MKKIISALLAATMIWSLAACSSQEANESASTDETTDTTAVSGEWTPQKDFTIVVPYEAGGNTDIPMRIFVQYMNKYSDKEFSVTNIVGSGGRAGAMEVMKAEPDGYTLLLQSSGFAMQYGLGIADFTYEDFAPIGYWLDSTMALVVNADSSYETYEDLVEAAKDNEGGTRMGSVTGTLPLFGLTAIEQKEGVTFNKVDLSGSAKAPELLSNRIDGYIDGFSSVKQYIDSGDFRCLAILASEPQKGYEDIPTFADLGYTDIAYLKQDFGLWAPKGTPEGAVEYINNVMKQAAEDPECIAELEAQGYGTKYSTTEDYIQSMEEIYSKFEEVAASMVQ